ncbi:hypothetical protein P9112_012204 [Eukaryota sp. TZLM1-RC]
MVSKPRKKHPKKVAIQHPLLKKHYDPKRTMKQNMAKLGLQVRPGAIPSQKPTAVSLGKKPSQPPQEIEQSLFTTPPSATPHKIMPPGDVSFVERMVKKHKLDFAKMFRDIDINVYQHTATVIRKKIILFVRLFPERAAELGIPTEVDQIPEIDF